MAEVNVAEGMGKCGARTKGSGRPCRNPSGWRTSHPGTLRCALHGGASPNGVAAARKIEIREAATKFGVPLEVDPGDALVGLVHQHAGTIAFVTQLVANAEPASVPQQWLNFLGEERRRLAAVAHSCCALGLEERRVRAVEQAGEIVARVLAAALSDLADFPAAGQIVRRHLLALDAGATNGATGATTHDDQGGRTP